MPGVYPPPKRMVCMHMKMLKFVNGPLNIMPCLFRLENVFLDLWVQALGRQECTVLCLSTTLLLHRCSNMLQFAILTNLKLWYVYETLSASPAKVVTFYMSKRFSLTQSNSNNAYITIFPIFISFIPFCAGTCLRTAGYIHYSIFMWLLLSLHKLKACNCLHTSRMYQSMVIHIHASYIDIVIMSYFL